MSRQTSPPADPGDQYMKIMNEKEQTLQGLRGGFTALHASSHPATAKAFTNLQQEIIANAGNTFYEQIKSVSYHPDLQLLEAIVETKKDYGYNGSLCSPGSYAFVRFYLNYGHGWEDQGHSAVNEHDIPTGTDCTKHPEKPLSYSASLKISPKTNRCSVHVLPQVRAVLEWNKIPPANNPNYSSIWGNTFNDHIQIKPAKEFTLSPVFNELLEQAILHPHLKLADAASLIPGGAAALEQSKAGYNAKPLELDALVALYKTHTSVSQSRFTLPHLSTILANYDSIAIAKSIDVWGKLGLDLSGILADLIKTNADVAYEQLESLGLDYNLEQFVASFRIKRPAGYSGDLCTHGSLEYVAFWADWGNNCRWDYVGTAAVNVHDINDIPKEGLSYAAVLPYDFNKIRKLCANPEVVKIRAVLSWSVPPSKADANKLEYYGNRLDAYIQVKPGVGTGTLKPIINILGGIPVDHISDTDGLTIPGATFAFNQQPVYDNSPFGGIIVVQGPLFTGHKYRIKVTDLNTLATSYVNNDLLIVGYLPVPPYVQYNTLSVDAQNYYTFSGFDQNTDSILARFNPGSNNLLKLELEIEGVTGMFTKYLQMDNSAPQITLDVADMGDCSHYTVGNDITGSYSVYDAHLASYTLASTFGGSVNGFSNVSNIFSFPTVGTTSPCGKISLAAVEKTIYNSQWTGNESATEQIICLQGFKKQ